MRLVRRSWPNRSFLIIWGGQIPAHTKQHHFLWIVEPNEHLEQGAVIQTYTKIKQAPNFCLRLLQQHWLEAASQSKNTDKRRDDEFHATSFLNMHPFTSLSKTKSPQP